MSKPKAKKPEKRWGWSYILDGVPATITFDGRDILVLDGSFPGQHRNVMRVLRILNRIK
jgi:hypothetical protein